MPYNEFKPQVWSSALLANFRKNLTAYDIANTDYEGDFMQGASTVRVIRPAAGTVGNYSTSTPITWSEVTSPYVDLDLDQQQYIALKVEDVDQAQTNLSILDSIVGPSGAALAAAVDRYIYGLAATAVTGGAGDVNLDISDLSVLDGEVYAALLEAAENLDNNDAPREGRFVVASPRFYRAALMDADYIPASQLAEGMYVDGAVGRIAGFDIIPSNNVNVGTGADAGEHRLFYGVKGSFAAAVRLDGAPEAMRLTDHFATGVRMLTLYGADIVNPAGLGRIVATTQ